MALYQSDGLRISTYANGDTPYIKDGYWWIGNKNLNIKAEGVDGKDGQNGIDGTSASPVYAIELSNDNATIGTDADGKSWNADLLKLVSTINVSVSEGETDITNNCDFDWTSNGCTLVEDDVEGVTQTCKWLTNISADSASVTIFVTQINPLKTIGFKTFTITKQKQGVQGIPGPKGNDGTGVAVKASAEDCTEIGDAYIDSDGNLLILTVLPDTFTNGGQIKGPPGTSSYLHVAYADDASGTNMDQDPSGKAYIGTYVDEEQKDSQDPSDYKWTKWEGDAAVTYVLSVSPNSWNISDSASIEPVLSITKYVGNTVSAAPSSEYLIKGIKNNTEYNWPNSTQWPDNKISASTTFKLYIKDENGNFTIQADSETITANKNGRGILSTTVTHAKTSTLVDDPSSIPEYSQNNPDGWASRLPTVGENEYLWTRTIIDYTDGDDTVTYSYMYQGKTVKGDSITVKSILYQIGDTSTTPPTGTWKALSEVGTVPTQKYLWSKTTFSDNTFVYGTSYQSKDGADSTVPGPQGIRGAKTEAIRIYYLSNSLKPPPAPTGTSLPNDWYETLQTASSTKKYVYSTTGTKTTTYASADGKNGTPKYNSDWGKVELYRAWPGNDSAVTQEDYAIFLQTTKGDNQGLFKNEDNGKVYINAEAIQAGMLQVKKDGNVILSAAFDGNDAGKVIIAGWTATYNALSTSNVGLISSDDIKKESLLNSGGTSPIRIYCGEGEIVNAPYVVLDDGSLYAKAAKFSGGNVIIDGDVILGGQTVTKTQENITDAKKDATSAITMVNRTQQDLNRLNNRVTALENAGGGGEEPEEPTITDETTQELIKTEKENGIRTLKDLLGKVEGAAIGAEGIADYILYDLDDVFLAAGKKIDKQILEVQEQQNYNSLLIECPVTIHANSKDYAITDVWLVIYEPYNENADYSDFLESLKDTIVVDEGNAQLVDYDSAELYEASYLRVRYHFETPATSFQIGLNNELLQIVDIQILQIGG